MKNALPIAFHESLQAYLDKLYKSFKEEISFSLQAYSNELYGELYYYSVVKLLNHITITQTDHFLDIGSGLGKLLFQVYLTTSITKATGIEINPKRHSIAHQIQKILSQQFPFLFEEMPSRRLNLIQNDFLKYHLLDPNTIGDVSIAYICATVFSEELISAIGKKLNTLPYLHTIIATRKLPHLSRFYISKKIFLHGDWDRTPCFIYTRKDKSFAC